MCESSVECGTEEWGIVKEWRCACALVRLVGAEERRIDGLHTGRARKGAHQPVVDAFDVIVVHTGQKADRVIDAKFNHADDTSAGGKKEKRGHISNGLLWHSKHTKTTLTYSLFFLQPSYEPVGKCWIRPIRCAIFTCSSSVNWLAWRLTLGEG